MSAFQVSNLHVSAIVYARRQVAQTTPILPLPELDDTAFGAALVTANATAVQARYRGRYTGASPEALAAAYRFDGIPTGALLRIAGTEDPAVRGMALTFGLYKLIDSFCHQCDETDDWEESDLCRGLRDLQVALIRTSPAWDRAPWTM